MYSFKNIYSFSSNILKYNFTKKSLINPTVSRWNIMATKQPCPIESINHWYKLKQFWVCKNLNYFSNLTECIGLKSFITFSLNIFHKYILLSNFFTKQIVSRWNIIYKKQYLLWNNLPSHHQKNIRSSILIFLKTWDRISIPECTSGNHVTACNIDGRIPFLLKYIDIFSIRKTSYALPFALAVGYWFFLGYTSLISICAYVIRDRITLVKDCCTCHKLHHNNRFSAY